MTDTVASTEADDRHAEYVRKTHEEVDFRLSIALDLVFGFKDENQEHSVSLTLVTPGGVITGVAVHRKAYAEAQISKVGVASETMGEALSIVEKAQDDRLEEIEEEADAEEARAGRPLRHYAHFTAATIFSGGVQLPVSQLRVKLKDVTAWSFDNLTSPAQ